MSSSFLLHFNTIAPGRINLIGNHVDYNGYSVLPIALKKATECSVDVFLSQEQNSKTKIYVTNVDKVSFPGDFHWEWFDQELHSNTSLQTSTQSSGESTHTVTSQHQENDWAKYVHAAFNTFWKQKLENKESFGNGNYIVNIKISSNLPIASGLSSSAALLCASMLVAHVVHLLQIHSIDESNIDTFSSILNSTLIPKEQYSEWCQKAENSLGMMCGGMDFAISMLGEEGMAKHISFNPLRHESIQLPENLTIVVANSLIRSKKLASDSFNRRVMECRLGSVILAKYFHLEGWDKHWMIPAQIQHKLGKTLPEMLEIVQEILPDKPLDITEVASLLELSVGTVMNTYFQKIRLADTSMKELKLRRRLLHAYSESNRVNKFVQACRSTELRREQKLQQFRDIFIEAHKSCQENYETSVPELDELISLNFSFEGVVASKFCGAGFGGITITLVDSSIEGTVQRVMDSIWEGYYKKIFADNLPERNQVLFSSTPSNGARIILS